MKYVKKKLQSNVRSLVIQVHTRLQKLPKDLGQDTFVAMNALHVRCLQTLSWFLNSYEQNNIAILQR